MTAKTLQALLDVWTWKEQAYQEVEHLPIEHAIRKRLEDSLRSVRQLGMTVSVKGEERNSRPVVQQAMGA